MPLIFSQDLVLFFQGASSSEQQSGLKYLKKKSSWLRTEKTIRESSYPKEARKNFLKSAISTMQWILFSRSIFNFSIMISSMLLEAAFSLNKFFQNINIANSSHFSLSLTSILDCPSISSSESKIRCFLSSSLRLLEEF